MAVTVSAGGGKYGPTRYYQRECDCDQSFDVHPPGYHARDCLIWGPRYNQPDDYEFAFTNRRGDLRRAHP